MPEVSMKNLLSAGVHFGHQTHRWNPKMQPFIYGPRNGIHIIDLEKTVNQATEACKFVKKVASNGEKVLFVGTKRQAAPLVKEAALRAEMPFVTERWLGGTLTNFSTIRRGVEKLEELERMKEDGTYELLPKKETVSLERKRKKLESSVGGIRTLKGHPAAVFVIDPDMEDIAVKEANKLGVPVVALVDTNCDPDPIDYIIPGNDDALKSITLFVNLIADAVLEGSADFEQSLRQASTADKPKKEAGGKQEKPLGPVIERVVRRKLKIPTDIDYREPAEEEETPEVEKQAAEATDAGQAAQAGAAEAQPPAEEKATETAASTESPKEDKPKD